MRNLEWLRVLAVLALLAPFVYLSTRLYGRSLSLRYQGRHLVVMESVAFGQNQRLVLIKVAGRVLLVGFGDHSTALIKEFDQAEFSEAGSTGTASLGLGTRMKTKRTPDGDLASGVGAFDVGVGEGAEEGEGGRSWAGLVESLRGHLEDLKTLRTPWRR